jgi:hypothetical protein
MTIMNRAVENRRPIVHRLKCVEPYYSEQWNGNKPFELRKLDRPYQFGDYILLEKWASNGCELTRKGSYMLLLITCVVKNDPPAVNLPEDQAILGTMTIAKSRYEP